MSQVKLYDKITERARKKHRDKYQQKFYSVRPVDIRMWEENGGVG